MLLNFLLVNGDQFKLLEKVSELGELCSLCDEKDVDVRITTKKLAMVSLLTVFKDIIPG